jgi:DNA/RNA-binding domain of Phe-tRNA-synthetase-like protein
LSGEAQFGWVADEVRAELPDLRLWTLPVAAAPGPSDPGLRRRLRELSDRVAGARAIAMRREPVPHAYRVLFRHVGLDPDAERTPIEAAVVDRLLHGGFRSRNRVDDALTIALVETGVPVWALDAAAVRGRLGIGIERERLVVADEAGPVCELFAPPGPAHGVGPATRELLLFAVQPAGVPAVHVDEALWLVAEALDPEGDERYAPA